MLIHITAFTAFINYAIDDGDVTEPLLHLLPIVITFGTFLISQVIGILIMYNKILKLRPIVALRVLK